MREYEARDESKIRVPRNKSVIAGAEVASILDRLTESIPISDFRSVVKTIEDNICALRFRYESRFDKFEFQQYLWDFRNSIEETHIFV